MTERKLLSSRLTRLVAAAWLVAWIAGCGSSTSPTSDGSAPEADKGGGSDTVTPPDPDIGVPDFTLPDVAPPPDGAPPPPDTAVPPPDTAVPPPDTAVPPPPDTGPAPDTTVDAGPPPDSTVDTAPQPDGPPPPPPGSAIVDIRADNNRNGTVDLTDATEDTDEDSWDASHGAVFLANIDDDDTSCPALTSSISDTALAACHDAANETIDGASDVEDLAPLQIAAWPGAPNGAEGKITLTLPIGTGADARGYVRLFKATGPGTYAVFGKSDRITAAELRQGVELALEGRDIVRDSAKWDGFVDVIFQVTYTDDAGQSQTDSDKLRMRVAPLLTSHHLQLTEQVFVTGTSGNDSLDFRNDVTAVVQAAGLTQGMIQIGTNDQWTQDFFETGWMSMPKPGGQHAITVYLRSANVEAPSDPVAPLRYAGRIVYLLRGQDVAAVQQYDLNHSGQMDTLNSLGNLETIPPYSHGGKSYPMGRVMMGKVSNFYPAPSFTKLLASQSVQPPVWLDTSWLLVGHVDETTSFIPASTARGWALALNDAAMAKKMLEDAKAAGHGAVKMFVGKYWLNDFNQQVSAEISIDDVLADTEVMAESANAVVEVAAQLAILKQETGITDAEIIPVPFLHYTVGGYSAAYQPGTVNSILIGDGHYGVPDPYGPEIGGVDIFKKQLEDVFTPYGITIHYVEDWNLYHRLLGEVHCGTNSQRTIPSAKWWESGL